MQISCIRRPGSIAHRQRAAVHELEQFGFAEARTVRLAQAHARDPRCRATEHPSFRGSRFPPPWECRRGSKLLLSAELSGLRLPFAFAELDLARRSGLRRTDPRPCRSAALAVRDRTAAGSNPIKVPAGTFQTHGTSKGWNLERCAQRGFRRWQRRAEVQVVTGGAIQRWASANVEIEVAIAAALKSCLPCREPQALAVDRAGGDSRFHCMRYSSNLPVASSPGMESDSDSVVPRNASSDIRSSPALRSLAPPGTRVARTESREQIRKVPRPSKEKQLRN